MIPNSLYELSPIVDDPRFEGFAFNRDVSFRGKGSLQVDFMPDNILTQGRGWTMAPIKPHWIPQKVIGRVRPFNDYPCVSLTIPAFSGRAVEALRDLLEPNGELLPLITDTGDYYAFNVTKVVDILNHEKSNITWANETKVTAFWIERYECVGEKMANLSIFRIVEKPSTIYVSQIFVDWVHKHNLQGFRFIKLWPLPEGARTPSALRLQ